jgi:DNA-binding transcriptional ArsR family regulator
LFYCHSVNAGSSSVLFHSLEGEPKIVPFTRINSAFRSSRFDTADKFRAGKQLLYSLTGIFPVGYIMCSGIINSRRRSCGNMNTNLLSALSEPSRMQMVELLRKGPLTVGEIADRLNIRQPQVSKHLKVLHEAGVVDMYAEANRRIYKLRPEPFESLHTWLERYRSLWEERFDNLDIYLEELQKKQDRP